MLHGLQLELLQSEQAFGRDRALLHEAQEPPIGLAAGCSRVLVRPELAFSEQIRGRAVELVGAKLGQASYRLEQDRLDDIHHQALAS